MHKALMTGFVIVWVMLGVRALQDIAINTHKVMEELREMNRILKNSQS